MGFSLQNLFRIQKFFAAAPVAAHPQLVKTWLLTCMQWKQPANLERGQGWLQTAPPTLFFWQICKLSKIEKDPSAFVWIAKNQPGKGEEIIHFMKNSLNMIGAKNYFYLILLWHSGGTGREEVGILGDEFHLHWGYMNVWRKISRNDDLKLLGAKVI